MPVSGGRSTVPRCRAPTSAMIGTSLPSSPRSTRPGAATVRRRDPRKQPGQSRVRARFLHHRPVPVPVAVGPVPITDGKVHDVRMLDELLPEPGAVYVMNRAYVDFARLYRFQQAGAFFVVRSKKNLKLRRVHSKPKEPDSRIRSDQMVVLTGKKTAKAYPDQVHEAKLARQALSRHVGECGQIATVDGGHRLR